MDQAVLHLDGDAFFASVEQALDPKLRGVPVMTGAERGIVAAFSYEAKARGITRGMQTWKARQVCPELVVRSSDYRTYQVFSRRAAAIMRRHVPVVEEYGIDECFACIPGVTLADGEAAARKIQSDILRELGVGYSVGIAGTKSLAKLGSKWRKPLGITVVTEETREEMLAQTPVGKLWGVGRRMAPWLMARGIYTALDLARRDETWVSRALDKPYLCMWAELRGVPALPFDGKGREQRGSVQKTQTFWPASADRRVLWSRLSRNVERACEKLRADRIVARSFSVFLKTQEFSYRRVNGMLPRPTAYPEEVLAAIEPLFDRIWRQDVSCRATGVTLWETAPLVPRQRPLFLTQATPDAGLARLWEAVDRINAHARKVWIGEKPRNQARVFRLPLLAGSARCRVIRPRPRGVSPNAPTRRKERIPIRQCLGLAVARVTLRDACLVVGQAREREEHAREPVQEPEQLRREVLGAVARRPDRAPLQRARRRARDIEPRRELAAARYDERRELRRALVDVRDDLLEVRGVPRTDHELRLVAEAERGHLGLRDEEHLLEREARLVHEAGGRDARPADERVGRVEMTEGVEERPALGMLLPPDADDAVVP